MEITIFLVSFIVSYLILITAKPIYVQNNTNKRVNRYKSASLSLCMGLFVLLIYNIQFMSPHSSPSHQHPPHESIIVESKPLTNQSIAY